MYKTNFYLYQNVFILRALLKLLNGLPDDGIYDVPKHVGYLLTCIYFGACKVDLPIPLAARSKARVCGRSPAEICGFESHRGHGCLS